MTGRIDIPGGHMTIQRGRQATGLRDLAREMGYQTGVARRSDLNPSAREHALVPGGQGQFDHQTLCSGGKATLQRSHSGTDCPRCLALLRVEAQEPTA